MDTTTSFIDDRAIKRLEPGDQRVVRATRAAMAAQPKTNKTVIEEIAGSELSLSAFAVLTETANITFAKATAEDGPRCAAMTVLMVGMAIGDRLHADRTAAATATTATHAPHGDATGDTTAGLIVPDLSAKVMPVCPECGEADCPGAGVRPGIRLFDALTGLS